MGKADELRASAKELEVAVTKLVSAFLVENGNCEVRIEVDNRKIIIDGRYAPMHPEVTVKITI